MGSKMFLLLVLVLLMFIDHSQGAHEKHNLTVSTSSTHASAVEPLTTAVTVNRPTTRRQHRRGCHCRGEADVIRTSSKGREIITARCLCQQSTKRSGKHGRLKKLCQREKAKTLNKCRRFLRAHRGSESMQMIPSVPI